VTAEPRAHKAELLQRGLQLVGLRLDGLELVIPAYAPIELRGSTSEITEITVTVLVDELAVIRSDADVAAEPATAPSTPAVAGPNDLPGGAR
jgi:hypothetical protein